MNKLIINKLISDISCLANNTERINLTNLPNLKLSKMRSLGFSTERDSAIYINMFKYFYNEHYIVLLLIFILYGVTAEKMRLHC